MSVRSVLRRDGSILSRIRLRPRLPRSTMARLPPVAPTHLLRIYPREARRQASEPRRQEKLRSKVPLVRETRFGREAGHVRSRRVSAVGGHSPRIGSGPVTHRGDPREPASSADVIMQEIRDGGYDMTSVLLLAIALLQSAPERAAMEAAWDYSKSCRGQTMVVLYDGKPVFERYASGGSPGTLQMLASGSKSFVGIAAIAAVEDGLLRLDDLACESLTEWKSDPQKSKITYRHLLTLTSGLEPGGNLGRARAYTWKQMIAKASKTAPGTAFEYGPSHLIAFAEALQRKLKGETFEAYLERRVFRPLGVKVEWRSRNADGNPQVAGGAAMTARDWATFGDWVRLKGKRAGKHLIRASLFDELSKGTPQNPAYGLTWWLVRPVTEQHKREIPIVRNELTGLLDASWVPSDTLIAAGLGKQRLYVIRSRNLVVVRQGPLIGGRRYNDAEFLSRLLRGKPASDR